MTSCKKKKTKLRGIEFESNGRMTYLDDRGDLAGISERGALDGEEAARLSDTAARVVVRVVAVVDGVLEGGDVPPSFV
jgi:hypothetical protein